MATHLNCFNSARESRPRRVNQPESVSVDQARRRAVARAAEGPGGGTPTLLGYRRLHVLIRREGRRVNRKKVQRLYRKEKLTVRRCGGCKRALGERRPIETPQALNQRWSLDFVSDQMTDGRRLRILEVFADCTGECLALVADTSISGRRVARELDAIIAWRGRPACIVSDNGTWMTCRV